MLQQSAGPAVFCSVQPPPLVPARWHDGEPDLYDVAVIGAGPSGLSAAINSASEGLTTVLLADRMGGQAGTSSRIENFLGFPQGISGPALTKRALAQARKFGTAVRSCSVEHLAPDEHGYNATTAAGETIRSRSVIVASGARYNRLDPRTDHLRFNEDGGVHYSATFRDLRKCGREAVAVVGGGNSAGQAVLFLADHIEKVHLIVRRDNLQDTMSAYLIGRIIRHPRIEIHFSREVKRVIGNRRVEGLRLSSGEGLRVSDVFVMIGARPNTGFLQDVCCMDEDGFVVTDDKQRASTPGLFAAGDVRAGSVKRVANAVGEGASVVPQVWSFLKEGAVCSL